VLRVEGPFLALRVVEKNIVCPTESLRSLLGVRMPRGALPDDLVLEAALPEDLVEHHLDIVAGGPVTVAVETARRCEDARQWTAAREHRVDVGARRSVAVVEGPLLLRLAPERLIDAVRVERRVDVDQIDALVGQEFQFVEVVAAPDRLGVEGGKLPCGP